MASIKLPLWLRATLLIGVVILVTAGSLHGYRYYTYPRTLAVAVGSVDGILKARRDNPHCKQVPERSRDGSLMLKSTRRLCVTPGKDAVDP